MDLSTTYMGLSLNNPIIVGACDLTGHMDSLKKLEEAGAGAVVIKSLFEEQIQLERVKHHEQAARFEDIDPEIARNFFATVEHAGPEEHLMWTRMAKDALSIPVIASLNCIHWETWTEYAKKLEKTGVDGLELNFYSEPIDAGKSAKAIEATQFRILKNVISAVSIPVSVKLSPFYTNLLALIAEMDALKVRAYVLFNRLFQPDIDVIREAQILPPHLSAPGAHRLPLRFAGLLYGNISADICTGSGIHSGRDVAKMILAGAGCVQVVSALYRHKIGHLSVMLEDLKSWMKEKGYEKISDFQGKLSRKNIADPWVYHRAQYVRQLMKGNPLEDEK